LISHSSWISSEYFMLATSVADAYLETQVQTASPERLHMMVVDAAIRYARQGAAAMAEKKFDQSFEALNRSRACVNELMTGIRTDPNPELAEQLKGLFLFVHRNLVLADLQRDPARIADGLQILEHHRQTWIELTEKLREVPTQESVATPESDVASRSWST
jgi:flagellar protein FliS